MKFQFTSTKQQKNSHNQAPNSKQLQIKNSCETGFTLIELIVVITMIAVLTLGLIFTFNPITQFNKARDGQREHDLSQLQAALDTYYNDTHCYPQTLTSLTTKYMQKLPTDPDSNSTSPYIYQNDGSRCPQWSVLYASLKAPVAISTPCPLVSRSNSGVECVPTDYLTSVYNYCITSGAIDCSYISSTTIGHQGSSSDRGSQLPTPTPTPYIVNCPGDNYYGCTGGNNSCNSIFPSSQCFGRGGTIQCYCDPQCKVNNISQCN